jgi:hypothetical protein
LGEPQPLAAMVACAAASFGNINPDLIGAQSQAEATETNDNKQIHSFMSEDCDAPVSRPHSPALALMIVLVVT